MGEESPIHSVGRQDRVRDLPLRDFALDAPKLVSRKEYDYRWAIPIDDPRLRKLMGSSSIEVLRAQVVLEYFPQGLKEDAAPVAVPEDCPPLRGSEGASGFILRGKVFVLSRPIPATER